MVSSGWESRMPVLARMTVSGVLSSCEASATNCRCCAQLRSTGRTTHADKKKLMRNNAISPAAPSCRAEVKKERIEAYSCVRSTKAIHICPCCPRARYRRSSPLSVPLFFPLDSILSSAASTAWLTVASLTVRLSLW